MYTGLSWAPRPREAKPNLGQLYLSQLSLAKQARFNFLKTPVSVYCTGQQRFYSLDASSLRLTKIIRMADSLSYKILC